MLIVCSAGFVCLLVRFLVYHYNFTVYVQINSLLITSGWCLKLLTLSSESTSTIIRITSTTTSTSTSDAHGALERDIICVEDGQVVNS